MKKLHSFPHWVIDLILFIILTHKQVKAAFTRAYNKESHATPFAVVSVTKKKKKKAGGDEETYGDDDEIEESEEEDDDITKDAMIKVNVILFIAVCCKKSSIFYFNDSYLNINFIF